MRIPTVAFLTLFALFAIPATHAGTMITGTPSVALAQESQPPAPPESQPSQPSQPSSQPQQSSPSQSSSPQLNVTVDQQPASTVWYGNPTWIAIGAIAVGLLIVLIVMAARGGSGSGPTVVRGA